MSDSEFDIQKFLAENFPPHPPRPPRPPVPVPPPPASDSPPAILARLIYFGTAPKPLPAWPPEWQQAYQVVSQVRGSLHDRMNAFEDYIATRPNQIEMHVRLSEATPVRSSRGERYRHIYNAEESCRFSSPLDWAVAGLFARPSVNLLVGDPGAKKTLLALDLAVSVASGTPWLGHAIGISPLTTDNLPTVSAEPPGISGKAPLSLLEGERLGVRGVGEGEGSSPVPVLLIDEETGKPRIFSRIRGAMGAHNAPLDIPLYTLPLPGFNLADEKEIDQLQELAQSVNAGLIIIDALADVLRGHNENTVNSVEPFFNDLRILAEKLHAAILIIHHNNKSGTIRGSSVLQAAVDLLLSIKSPSDSDLIYLRPLKTREAALDPITAQIHFNGDQFHLTLSNETPAFALAESTIKSEILAYLAKHGNATTPELMAWLSENNPGSVRNYVNYLLSTKQIRRVNIDEKGKPALFELAIKDKNL